MRHPFHTCGVLLLLISSICGLTRLEGQKKWTPPKTTTGDPDLQGTWTSTTTTPFERPAQFGNRLFLTDEEFAASQKQLERQLVADSEEANSSNTRTSTGPPDHWTERAS